MGDTISRHGTSAWLENMGHPNLAKMIMDEKRFPSAQPEIIRCKNCKHFDPIYTFDKGVCGHWHARANASDFCSAAEKREVKE